MSKQPFTYEEFKQIYSKVTRLCVDGAVRTPDGIVLGLRKEGIGWANQWHTPGGTVFYNEHIQDALKRVVKAETGLDIKIVKLLGYMEALSEQKERGFGWSVSLYFLCDAVGGKLQHDDGATEMKAFKELPENTVIDQKEFLTKYWDEISKGKF